jgi:ABC-2 type transport system ATP-binding protein
MSVLEAPLTDSAVTLENIAKSYRSGFSRERKMAVEDLSIEVTIGEVFGLLGPNGAGKTTTLKILLGIIYPDDGRGTVLGRPLGDRASHYRLGFLPEQPYFYGFFTAEKALDFYGKLFGLDKNERATRSARLMDMVGLRPGSHLTLDKYSKGMLQRFGIAQALINDPELVIMDEPSSGLDPVGQKEIRDVLVRLKEDGKTIFLSSHQLSEVENVCDSVSIMNRGKSVREGMLSELLAAEGMARIVLSGMESAAMDRFTSLARHREEANGNTVLEVSSGDVYRVLDLARELGLGLVSVEPSRRTLEDLFMEAVRE